MITIRTIALTLITLLIGAGCGHGSITHVTSPSHASVTGSRSGPFRAHDTIVVEDSKEPFETCKTEQTPELGTLNADTYCRCNMEGWESPSCTLFMTKIGFYPGMVMGGAMNAGRGNYYNAGFSVATPVAGATVAPATSVMDDEDRQAIATAIEDQEDRLDDHEKRINAATDIANGAWERTETARKATARKPPPRGEQKGNETPEESEESEPDVVDPYQAP